MVITEENVATIRGRSGIYQWTNPSGFIYRGQAKDLAKRKGSHETKSSNAHLRSSMKKYGPCSHKLEILEFVDRIEGESALEFAKRLTKREQFYLDEGRAQFGDKWMNLSPTASSQLGWKMNEAQLTRHAEIKRELGQDPTWKARHASVRARPEFREKMSEASKRRSESPEWIAHQAEAMKKRSESTEWRVNQAEAKKRLAQDPEWREKIADANRRKAQDPEWRAKLTSAMNDPEITARRMTRHAVMVDFKGETTKHKSTSAAFEALGLYSQGVGIKTCVRFRAKLKAEGQRTFKAPDGQEYHFQIIV
ncbi:hypothetical protein V4C53_30210 [Paraburkholderia azotifigens]|uniref:hypothetical protein n=1 Tax=Paraburkholderia azotifigens TaxID=2057004 RepID=UPI00316EBA25